MRTNGTTTNREDGDVDLGMGLCDTSGRTFFEDGNSLIIDEEGWVHPRKKGCIDTYFFGYGRDYFGAILTFTSYPARHRFCRNMLWATGGAGTGNILKKVIWLS